MINKVLNPLKLSSFKAIFASDVIYMLQLVVALLAFIFNAIWLSIVFFSLYLCAFLVFNDDMTTAILPLSLISMSLLKQYGAKVEDFLVYIPCVVLLIVCAVFHFIIYRPRFTHGNYIRSLIAVAIAVVTGGLFSISAKEYFAPFTLYYTLFLSAGVIIAYIIIRNYTSPYNGNIAEVISKQMIYVTLMGFLMLLVSVLPYIAKGKYDWFFTWKNTVTTFMLISSPFAFYTAAKENFSFKAFICFCTGIAGYLTAILTYSRGGILFGSISLLLCIVACLIVCEKRNRIVFITTLLLMAITAVTLIAVYSNVISEIISSLTFSKDEARVRLWKEAIENFIKNPLFGAGLGWQGGTAFNHQTGSMYWYHSTVFQVIGSMGIAGIIAYSYNYIQKCAIILRKKRKFNLFFALSFIGFELYQLVDVGNFVPVPFVLIITHLFTCAEIYNTQNTDAEEAIDHYLKRKVNVENQSDNSVQSAR